MYKIKPTKKQIDIMKSGWKQLDVEEGRSSKMIMAIEKWMEKETGIKGIEFFRSPDDGCYCGIGNAERTMKLIQRGEYGLGE